MVAACVLTLLIAACGWYAPALGLSALCGIWLPCAAIAACGAGFAARLFALARTPLPYAIPLSGGQAGTPHAPESIPRLVARVLREVCGFASLLRHARATVDPERTPRLGFTPTPWLWAAALLFHYSLLVVMLRHVRLWLDPHPAWIAWLHRLDTPFDTGTPVVYLTGIGLCAALCVLLVRRLGDARLRRISLPADYFALCLLLALTVSGLAMRYVLRVDLTAVTQHMTALFRLAPPPADALNTLDAIFFAHLTLACALLIYAPHSKLIHFAVAVCAPTRAMRCDTGARRHSNPLLHPLPLAGDDSYAAYEARFAARMRTADIPLDRLLDTPAARIAEDA